MSTKYNGSKRDRWYNKADGRRRVEERGRSNRAIRGKGKGHQPILLSPFGLVVTTRCAYDDTVTDLDFLLYLQ